jgi:hypothetical protein
VKRIHRRWAPPPGAVIFASLPVNEEGRRVWQCSACGVKGIWAEGWQGYGSLLDEDDGYFQAVTCSKGCRAALEPHLKALLLDVEHQMDTP